MEKRGGKTKNKIYRFSELKQNIKQPSVLKFRVSHNCTSQLVGKLRVVWSRIISVKMTLLYMISHFLAG